VAAAPAPGAGVGDVVPLGFAWEHDATAATINGSAANRNWKCMEYSSSAKAFLVSAAS
jgi:hypothetical protein